MKIVDFSEIISPIDLKEGRSRHLIEFMKVCEIESECHFLTFSKVMYIQIFSKTTVPFETKVCIKA